MFNVFLTFAWKAHGNHIGSNICEVKIKAINLEMQSNHNTNSKLLIA